ncbi:TonB-dependent receptor [Altererythrobacter soli]|uniref:TonB-dependent receptor n=1 Tax=Croceibacterium soli TaxID=1739690 RepID=A0A6I4UPM1_9SPHN|nr:TonB-dependent receptor [Croceibacterium soli]MXP40732.1 TonB-dependent receptor [Croceibacterium soli]
MNTRSNSIGARRGRWLACAAAGALGIATLAAAAPAAAQESSQAFRIEEQPLADALLKVSRQGGVDIMAPEAVTRGRTAPAVSGRMTVPQALTRLLAGTGLRFRRSGDNGYLIESAEGNAPAAAADERTAAKRATAWKEGGVAEILVVGSRSQNVDIRRTEDDPQPYVIINREQIDRTNAQDTEDLLRQLLPMAAGTVSGKSGESNQGASSTLDLRGLGPRQTLILIDGRRVASRGAFGNQEQTDINSIPLGAIERIDVLPSTASGIFGGGATGGAVNIVLRSDYEGLQAQLTYGNAFRGQPETLRIDLSGGVTFNNGDTNIMFFASHADKDTLRFNDRNFYSRGIETILANNSNSIFNAASPPLGATTNIRSQTGAILTLRPEFGGGSIGSSRTFVPYGYLGPASDDGAGLIANAGNYDFDMANTAQTNGGGRRSLLAGSKLSSLSTTLRHEFDSSFAGFATISYSDSQSHFEGGQQSGATFALAPGAAGNPFNEAIRVTVPLVGTDEQLSSRNKSLRAVSGVTFDLPGSWKGAADYTWNKATFESRTMNTLNGLQTARVISGAIDVFSDLNLTPDVFAEFERPTNEFGPGKTIFNAAALRVGGPIQVSLPGGRPNFSGILEYRTEELKPFVAATTRYNGRSQDVISGYGELTLPLISEVNAIPAIHSLTAQAAVRTEWFRSTTSNVVGLIDPAPLTETRSKLHSTNPTLGLEWKPVRDIALRASYSTGFLPPSLTELSPGEPFLFDAALFQLFGITDPDRGDETLRDVLLISDSATSLRPETSRSTSFGIILTPRFIPGLRFSADYTRIRKKDAIANILDITTQAGLLQVLALAPDRIIRDTDPSTFGPFGVGPIIAADTGPLNISRYKVDALDLALSQTLSTSFGKFEIQGRATHAINNVTIIIPSADPVERAGLVDNPKWRGYGTLTWTHKQFSISWTSNCTSGYYTRPNRIVDPNLNSARVPSQMYHDLFVRYRLSPSFLKSAEIQAGVRNIFDKKPPAEIQSGIGSPYYSRWGDPRGANYYLTFRGEI